MGDKADPPRGPRPLRPTPQDKIFDPAPNRIFVFGSNREGIHGGGAARYAYRFCGAEWEEGEGLYGTSYAIPTKATISRSLKLEEIQKHVDTFIEFAWEHRELEFFITRLGCGLAGFTDDEIGPMFKDAPPNCELPHGWDKYSSDETADAG
jgi:hypothetical protein